MVEPLADARLKEETGMAQEQFRPADTSAMNAAEVLDTGRTARKIPDYVGMSAPLLLGTLGDDAAKWAEAFQQIIVDRGVKIDEGLMIGWFANAIEHSSDVRHWRAQPRTRLVFDAFPQANAVSGSISPTNQKEGG